MTILCTAFEELPVYFFGTTFEEFKIIDKPVFQDDFSIRVGEKVGIFLFNTNFTAVNQSINQSVGLSIGRSVGQLVSQLVKLELLAQKDTEI